MIMDLGSDLTIDLLKRSLEINNGYSIIVKQYYLINIYINSFALEYLIDHRDGYAIILNLISEIKFYLSFD